MPNRIIREGILTSERVERLEPVAEVFYRRLMSKVDDHGRYDARPSILRASLYPLRLDRVREADCTRLLAACEKAGLIALYSHDGKPYLQMLDTRWQVRSESKYPMPPDNICSQVLSNAHLVVVVDVDVVEDVVVVKKTKSKTDALGVAELLVDVDPQVLSDWKAIRKAKRLPVTRTALLAIQAEAGKLGMSLPDALAVSCKEGWAGFKGKWLEDGDRRINGSDRGGVTPEQLARLSAEIEATERPH